MNELQIFERENYTDLKAIDKKNKDKYTGFFYVLEWGGSVKIGSSKYPYQRLMALKRTAEKYGDEALGRIALSVPHTNYRENEKFIHKIFSKERKSDSELFDLYFDEALDRLPDCMDYKDDSEKLDEEATKVSDGFKSFLMGKFNDELNGIR